jgi:hypothetical protein
MWVLFRIHAISNWTEHCPVRETEIRFHGHKFTIAAQAAF